MNEPREYLDVHRFRLWFGVLGGAVAWTVHLLVSYAIAEFGCVSPFRDVRFLNVTGVAWLGILTSLAMLAVAVAATLVALRIKRRMVGSEDAIRYEAEDGRVFMARTGVLTSGLFVFIILVQALPFLYYLRSC